MRELAKNFRSSKENNKPLLTNTIPVKDENTKSLAQREMVVVVEEAAAMT